MFINPQGVLQLSQQLLLGRPFLPPVLVRLLKALWPMLAVMWCCSPM